MTKLTLPIVIGRQYQRRDGKVVMTIPCSNDTVARIMHDGVELRGEAVYLSNGRYRIDRQDHPADLASDFNPPALTLPIVIGKRYVRRDGVTIKARMRNPNIDPTQVYVGTLPMPDANPRAHVDEKTGKVYPNEVNPSDLVADHIEAGGNAPNIEASNGHPHAALMALYAQDAVETAEPWKLWQVYNPTRTEWEVCAFNPQWHPDAEYRHTPPVPPTIRIGEFDVPEPLRDAPSIDSKYWIPTTAGTLYHDGTYGTKWDGSTVDKSRLSCGLVHATREAALLHFEALISFTKAESAS